MRISKVEYYLNIAEEVARRSTCLRRSFGAVLVNHDEIIATGYSGSPRGTANCIDVGDCLRNQLHAKPGEHYEWCRSVHAEQNCIISSSRDRMIGSSMYLVGLTPIGMVLPDTFPCSICRRMIVNAGVHQVVCKVSHTMWKAHQVSAWVEQNLGAYKKVKGRFVPIRPEGY